MPKKSLQFYERITAQQILKINLEKCLKQECLNKLQRVRKLSSILSSFRKTIIPKGEFIPIKYYINFLEVIPNSMWSDKPIFYYNHFQWDALGLLGERIHRSTDRTKYLELCFKFLGIKITDILDNEHPDFYQYKNNKDRFIAALVMINQGLSSAELTRIMTKSRILSDERFIFE